MDQISESNASPACPEVGVVALVPDDWDHLWQPRHHVMARLATYFHVVWLNPAEHWKEMLRFQRTVLAPLPGNSGGFHVYRPARWLPTFYGPSLLAQWTAHVRVRRAVAMLRRLGCKRFVLYIWRPEFAEALRALRFDASLYHIDDEYSFSSSHEPVSSEERDLISRVDRVIVHSPRLLETKGGINPQTSMVPNGADFESYSSPRPEPGDLAAIPHPRVGYCGFLKQQMDWPLLETVVTRRPDLSFVFVGKLARHYEDQGTGLEDDLRLIQSLRERENVWFLGEKTAAELTAYPQNLDVCLLPYRLNAYTHCIYPMKLHEYLAAGRPVIGTRIRSLLEFNSVVDLVSDPEELEAAIVRSLSDQERSPERVRERQVLAESHDWDHMAARIAGLILDQLGLEDPSAIRRRTQPRRPPATGSVSGPPTRGRVAGGG